MYELLGICLVLTALLTVNALASLVMAACWRLGEVRLRSFSAHTRAEILFGMRIIPPAIALISVALLLIPAYVAYEPYATTEVVSAKLAALAFVSAAGLAFTLWRTCRSWFATRTLLREWLNAAQPMHLNGISIPAFRIEHSFPIIAVVGTMKPRLFIAEQVLRTLSDEELAAAIAHEGGHLKARDNLKRSTLRACRNALMIVPFGRSLDRAWAEAAESAADDHAARLNAATALNLASALVKIAKMVPAGARADVPLAAYLVGVDETQGVKTRVRHLLEIASTDVCKRSGNLWLARIVPVASLGCFALFATAVASNPKVLIAVHAIIERAVNLLC